VEQADGKRGFLKREARCCWASSPARPLGISFASRELTLALDACIAYNECMQYTIRKIPHSLDAALRRRAREQGKSLNEAAIEALARGAGVSEERSRQRDLRDIAGTWRSDRAFDRALAAQDTVDKELWQ
jgi:plasmid stability protein